MLTLYKTQPSESRWVANHSVDPEVRDSKSSFLQKATQETLSNLRLVFEVGLDEIVYEESVKNLELRHLKTHVRTETKQMGNKKTKVKDELTAKPLH